MNLSTLNRKFQKLTEFIVKYIFLTCALISCLAIASMTLYIIKKGLPAISELGLVELIFNTKWKPTATMPSFGIFYIILTSIFSTITAVLIGTPISILCAIFLSEIASKSIKRIVGGAIELLSSIPSVIYGLIGMSILNPWIYELEKLIFKGNSNHQFTGGSNLLSGIIILTIMILPTVICVSTTSLQAVHDDLRKASLALGATKLQTIFKVVLPAAKSGIVSGIVLGVGRALGEAMAINMVAGGSVNFPLPFNSVRTLTTQIVSEMGYAEGLHREVLFTVGLILFIFTMIVNYILLRIRKKGDFNEG